MNDLRTAFLAATLLAASSLLAPPAARASADTPLPYCTSHEECGDGIFCNGIEHCIGVGSGADARGCSLPSGGGCGPYEICDEANDRCFDDPACDGDGDGWASDACDGFDCDDNDSSRFPGNLERCTGPNDSNFFADHDEDCNPCTVSDPRLGVDGDDADLDGALSPSCSNPWEGAYTPSCNLEAVRVDENAQRVFGADCDDTNPAIVRASQICDPSSPASVLICGSTGWEPASCGSGMSCVPQPVGLGWCEHAAPRSCTLGARTIPHGVQVCELTVADRVAYCDNGVLSRLACPNSMTCVAQPSGAGICQHGNAPSPPRPR